MEYYLEGDLKERFCKLFPKHTNRRLMQWFGISFSTLQRFKREFGLEKDMKAICKEHAKDVKKICEKKGDRKCPLNPKTNLAILRIGRR